MSIVRELKRRNVFRMAGLYLVASWLIMQVADVLVDLAHLPQWIGPTTIWLLAIGFPISLIFSWFYEITPQGISLEKDVAPEKSITHVIGRRLDFIVISMLLAAVILFAYDKWWIGGPPDKSIAILPFTNMSDDLEQEYFSDGISEEILSALSKVKDLKVAGRTSSFYFKGKNEDLRNIGKALGVSHILEGSVRKAGTQIRITAQLIKADDGFHLWSDTYDRELTSIFEIQQEIAESIANALRVELSLEEQQRLDAKPTDNLQAYQAFLLGRQNMSKRTSAELEEAKTQFERAIELDPDYVLAYVGLADTYGHLARYGSYSPEDANTLAKPLVERALELDDQSGEAYTSLGSIYGNQYENAAAEKAYQRAIELNPNYADAYHYYAFMLMYSGRPEEALPLRQKGLELDPMSMLMNLNMGSNLLVLGRFDEAWDVYQRTIRIAPDSPIVYQFLGLFEYFVNGNLAESIRQDKEAVRLDPGDAGHAASLAMLYLDIGDLDNAHVWLERARGLNPDNFPTMTAAILINMGEDWTQAVRDSRHLLRLNLGNTVALTALAWDDARNGNHELALARYRDAAPELFAQEPEVTAANYQHAIEIASLLIDTGEHAGAETLLDGALTMFQGLPRFGITGYGFSDVVIHALKGDTNQALTILREVVDENLRGWWRFWVQKNPHLEPLHGDPRYQAIIADLEADMAAQLARLRAMEANGEPSSIPDIN